MGRERERELDIVRIALEHHYDLAYAAAARRAGKAVSPEALLARSLSEHARRFQPGGGEEASKQLLAEAKALLRAGPEALEARLSSLRERPP